MGGKSVSHRAAQYKARHRIVHESMKDLMESRANQERHPPFVGTVTCKHCGFKTHYPFYRCPQCEGEQK